MSCYSIKQTGRLRDMICHPTKLQVTEGHELLNKADRKTEGHELSFNKTDRKTEGHELSFNKVLTTEGHEQTGRLRDMSCHRIKC
jgi:hypothetical protein